MIQFKHCAFILINCTFINSFADQYVSSCIEFYKRDSNISSGEYVIYQNGNSIKVYCSFEEDWVYTYISKDAYKTTVDISKLYSTRDFAKLRIFFSNGTQNEVIVENLLQFQNSSTLYFGYNSTTSYQGPSHENTNMAPYLFLGFLPISLAKEESEQGYRAAKQDFIFTNCDANPNSYITLYYNPKLTYPGRVGNTNSFMNGWIRRSSTLSSSKHMEKEFYFDFEMHMGGCGGFMTSYSMNNIRVALGLPVYAIVVTNATTSTFTNEDSNDIGMVIGLVVGLVLVILVLVVTFIFIRRFFGSSKRKEPKDGYTTSQNDEMARGTGHLNNTYLDLKKTTDYPYQNLTNSDVSGRKQDLKQTNLNYDYATVEPSTEQGYTSKMISNDAASNNYLVLDPQITGYNRSEDKTKTEQQYELAQPVNTSQDKTSFDSTTYLTDDTYGLSEEGVYDSSRDNRHKKSTNNIYSHTVDTVYDSTSCYRSDSENQDTYDHFNGGKAEDQYDISKCS
ncbi:uncharacterized protein [Mytilus edulis]|uniref:uncharacterized protein n=1 Tax=Mytilus edulis TaxID=6550 RepID=UPI0039EFD134